ncbi:hypothetical protein D5085_03950 [Ectothiorhodospiraceae bacterium BW-2]|nr:hypothetical protein D5085_03950 [Ectothiorhodospiraceae bacterium BW-2]
MELTPPMSRELRYYNGVLALLLPLLLLVTLWHAYRRRGGWRFIRQRLALLPSEPASIGSWWFHAASVGEVNGLIPLLQRLQQRKPQQPIVLTTTTPQGRERAAQRLPNIACYYLPLDYGRLLRRFIAHHRPQRLLLMETELWPNLIACARESQLPLWVINGRLSAKTSQRAPSWLRRLYGQSLQQCTMILCRAESDWQQFIALGAPPQRCRVVGNLKYSAPLTVAEGEIESVVPTDRPYILLASTREGEERLLIEALSQLPQWRDYLWVVAPRHPERREAIKRQLHPFELAVRTAAEPISATTAIYLLDTLGELTAAMARATLVVMGGSFSDKGGHNLLEPAALGRAVVVGPDMANFATETAAMVAYGAALQLESVAALPPLLAQLLAETNRLTQMGEQARRYIAQQADIVERYLASLAIE